MTHTSRIWAFLTLTLTLITAVYTFFVFRNGDVFAGAAVKCPAPKQICANGECGKNMLCQKGTCGKNCDCGMNKA